MSDADKTRERNELFNYLNNKLNIQNLVTVDHPEAPTCDEWLQFLSNNNNNEENAISLDNSFLIKNLLLRDHKKKSVLIYVIANEPTPIDLKVLTKAFGFSGSNPLRFLPPENLSETVNVEKGNLTALAFYLLAQDDSQLTEHEIKVKQVMKTIQILVDHTLFMEDKNFLFHPLKNTSTTVISRADFVKFMRSVLGEEHVRQISLFDFSSQTKIPFPEQ